MYQAQSTAIMGEEGPPPPSYGFSFLLTITNYTDKVVTLPQLTPAVHKSNATENIHVHVGMHAHFSLGTMDEVVHCVGYSTCSVHVGMIQSCPRGEPS